MRQIQQGDVLLQQVKQIPTGTKARTPGTRGHVLAEGEATGHAHVIDATEGLELREAPDGTLYARITSAVELRHEEHQTVTVPPGVYKVGKVQEFDHFAEEARDVLD